MMWYIYLSLNSKQFYLPHKTKKFNWLVYDFTRDSINIKLISLFDNDICIIIK